MKTLTLYAAAFSWVWLAAAVCHAEGEGQADLDQATELKLSAESLDDLDKVVTLCESALKKGLDDGGRRFATQLLTSTLYQHAIQLCAPIFEAKQPDPRWPVLRQFAVRDLERALAYDATLGNAHLLLAKLMVLPGGDSRRAIESVNKAVEHLGEDRDQMAEALVMRSKLTGEPEQRIADLNKALELAPENLDALRTRGMIFLIQGDTEKALADLEKVMEKAPEDVTVWAAAAELLASQNKFDQALEHINQAIETNPEKASVYLVRARIRAMQDQAGDALADLNKALEIDDKNLPALLMRARVYQTEGELEKAKQDIDAALKIRPDLTQALLLQALNAAAAGKMGDAIVSMRRALAHDPQNVQARLQLAAFYVADSRPRAAIKVYDEILVEDDDNRMAVRGRGDAYLAIGEHKKAIADLEAALAEAPEDSGTLNNLAWVLATSPSDDLRNGRRALELAEKACQLTNYQTAHILSTLASAHAELGQFDEAVKWSNKSIELADDDEMKKQLNNELEHYQKKMPFRELQQTEENKQPLKFGPGEFEL